MTTALSPCRMAWPMPDVFAALSVHTSSSTPASVVTLPTGFVPGLGSMARIGRPAVPVHPQNVTGFGVSAMN